ncbi:hypothetical protein H0E87_025263, partial [Populus deltoides]
AFRYAKSLVDVVFAVVFDGVLVEFFFSSGSLQGVCWCVSLFLVAVGAIRAVSWCLAVLAF